MMVSQSEEKDEDEKRRGRKVDDGSKSTFGGGRALGLASVASQLSPGGKPLLLQAVFFLLSLRVRPDGALFGGEGAQQAVML